jgi:formiminoglutamate deiminase
VRPSPRAVVPLRGVVLPGAANGHSHAFHRALRGRTHAEGGSFWTWRERMYAVAARLDPDRLFALARATFAEMTLAGFTSVGEFHYVHHQPDGRPYTDPNAMGAALIAAARDAGIRIALLDVCYLAGGFDAPLAPEQRRFGDGEVARWEARAESLRSDHAQLSGVVIGAAIHSVRAVPASAIPTVAGWVQRHGAPLHVHVSEQPAENAACRAAHGRSPTQLLADLGALGPRTTAVHATHLDDRDVELLASTGTTVCLCPTTERDLGDGIGPARALVAAGVPLSLGSDGHARIDAYAEARAVELDQRLVSLERGCCRSRRWWRR